MAYKVSLKDFEGPLDLLLTLIGKAKIDIKDIFVSEITEQYLGYMDQLERTRYGLCQRIHRNGRNAARNQVALHAA